MKQTEIGIIPEDWEVKELGEIVTAYKLGGNYKTKQNVNDFPVIKMGNIGRGFIVTDKLEYVDESYNVGDVLKYGDLLFNTRNTLELVGKVAIWRNELPFALYNSNLLKIEFQKKYVSSNFYMNYIFNDRRIIKQLSDIATGTTSVAAIYTRDLLGIKIPLPPLAEQEAISAALSDADAWIDSLEQLIAKKRLIKQGTMQTLLTPPSEELVLSGVEAWEVKKLWGLIENIIDNRGKTPPIDKNGYNLLEVNSLGSRHPDLNKVSKFISQFNYDNFLRKYLKIGDLLFSTVGNIGKTSIYNDINSCIAQNIVGFRFSKCNSYFMKYYFDTNIMQSRFESILMSGVQPSIKVTQLIRLEILIPSLSEQERIATILSDMDAELEALETQLGKARLIKQGMMQELLTGRVKLV